MNTHIQETTINELKEKIMDLKDDLVKYIHTHMHVYTHIHTYMYTHTQETTINELKEKIMDLKDDLVKLREASAEKDADLRALREQSERLRSENDALKNFLSGILCVCVYIHVCMHLCTLGGNRSAYVVKMTR
jgi:hypothetical protein